MVVRTEVIPTLATAASRSTQHSCLAHRPAIGISSLTQVHGSPGTVLLSELPLPSGTSDQLQQLVWLEKYQIKERTMTDTAPLRLPVVAIIVRDQLRQASSHRYTSNSSQSHTWQWHFPALIDEDQERALQRSAMHLHRGVQSGDLEDQILAKLP